MGSSPFKRIMSDRDLLLPDPLRRNAVIYLRANLHHETLYEVYELWKKNPEDWIHKAYAHHGFGTAIRNILREIIKDSELPPVDYDGEPMKNWDDWYIKVLEEAAGCYE